MPVCYGREFPGRRTYSRASHSAPPFVLFLFSILLFGRTAQPSCTLLRHSSVTSSAREPPRALDRGSKTRRAPHAPLTPQSAGPTASSQRVALGVSTLTFHPLFTRPLLVICWDFLLWRFRSVHSVPLILRSSPLARVWPTGREDGGGPWRRFPPRQFFPPKRGERK